MKKVVQWLAFWLSGCLACAQGTLQVVVPSGNANVEGNSASGDLFRTSASVFQQVYSASAFGFLGGTTGRIDGMAFRFDGGASNQGFVGIWPGISISLSTTLQNPDSLSPTYSQNGGSDEVIVFGGSLDIVAPSEPGLRSFQVVVPFQTPFFYDPSRGNLSLFMVSSAGPTNLFLDGQFAAGDSVGRVFGGFASTGIPDTLGLITRFNITPIPEPSSATLAAIGTLCLWLCFRRTRNAGR